MNLRRSEVQGDALMLVDSKTGTRKVPLGTQTRQIPEHQPRTDSPFVFPSPLDPSRPRGGELSLWYRVRKDAGIGDTRLHDLRHSCASIPANALLLFMFLVTRIFPSSYSHRIRSIS